MDEKTQEQQTRKKEFAVKRLFSEYVPPEMRGKGKLDPLVTIADHRYNPLHVACHSSGI
jgi:hypothetical protein